MLICSNAIADLMQQHRRELLRFLSQRIRCADTAQDLFQETFIRYAGYRDQEQIENPRAFIFKIAANLATDYLRGCARRPIEQADDDLHEQAIHEISAERAVVSTQELEALAEALAELPPKCQAVFVMLRIKHYSYAEVERELGISSTMIQKYLHRALTHCRQRLEAES